MGSLVTKHNARILRKTSNTPAEPPPKCNCQKQNVETCPLPGECKQFNVVYQATVKCEGANDQTYLGATKAFKLRYGAHKSSFNKDNKRNSTTLSTYYWKKKEEGKTPAVSWKIIENAPTFNPVTGKCMLCLREKFNIIVNHTLQVLIQEGRHFHFADTNTVN